MKALSIRQPWTHSIIHLGKPVENRDWLPGGRNLRDAHRLIGQEIFLHAGKGMSRGEYEDCLDFVHHEVSTRQPFPAGTMFPERQSLPRGGIVGRAKLVGVIVKAAGEPVGRDPALIAAWRSPWFVGPYGLVLADAKPTKFVRMNGTLTPIFFDVPAEIAREALAA